MNDIAIILPYFGIFPDYFQLFLNSCKYNSTIDFLIFTDDRKAYQYPPNVKVHYDSFEEFAARVQRIYDFDISLEKPYKLCDYKPAYGEIFEPEIDMGGYQFWGHCDCDLIFGDIRRFITPESLQNNDKIGHLGHFTLYRNTKENNRRYRMNTESQDANKPPYKEVFTSERVLGFDEYGIPGNENKFSVNQIYKDYHFPLDPCNCYSDLIPFTDQFEETILDFQTMKRHGKKIRLFRYINGRLFAEIDGQLQERLYVHFLKRKMTIKIPDESVNDYTIVPNAFLSGYKSRYNLYCYVARRINCSKIHRDYLVTRGRVIKCLRNTLVYKLYKDC